MKIKVFRNCSKVAKGITSMIDKTTYDTVHILNYPDLTVKFQNHFMMGKQL